MQFSTWCFTYRLLSFNWMWMWIAQFHENWGMLIYWVCILSLNEMYLGKGRGRKRSETLVFSMYSNNQFLSKFLQHGVVVGWWTITRKTPVQIPATPSTFVKISLFFIFRITVGITFQLNYFLPLGKGCVILERI